MLSLISKYIWTILRYKVDGPSYIHPYIYIPLSLPTFAQVSESLQDTSDPAAPDAGNQHGDAVDITAADTLPVSGWKNAHICTGAVIRVHMFCAIEIDGCCYCIYLFLAAMAWFSHPRLPLKNLPNKGIHRAREFPRQRKLPRKLR